MTQHSMPLATLQALSVFPYADEFPYISDDDSMSLAQDIEVNGLIHPIVLFQNEILDGRNRLRALAKTNHLIAPIEEFEGTELEAVEYVDSLNILRRHLTDAQRLVLAMARLPYMERDAHERRVAQLKQGQSAPTASADANGSPVSPGKAAAQAGERFNLSSASVERGKKLYVAEDRDENGVATRYVPVAGAESIVAAIKAGEITSVSGAVTELKRRQDEAVAAGAATPGDKAKSDDPADRFEKRVDRAVSSLSDAIADHAEFAQADDLRYIVEQLQGLIRQAERTFGG